MSTARAVVLFFVMVAGVLLPVQGGVEAADLVFDKDPGAFYTGQTQGLSGLDSIRALVDAAYYQRWQGYVPSDDASTRVIYGDDDRREPYDITDPQLLKLVQAAVVVVSTSEISDNGNGTFNLSTSAWTTQGGLPLCAGEPFAGQAQIGFCSGFLVGEDIIVTAGHCVDASDCGSVAFIFGFQQIDAVTGPQTTISADNVYFCDGIINQQLAGDNDHSVVRLDRAVVGRTPIPVRRSGLVDNGDSLVVVGHGIVLPMKVAG
ncbi:MAG: serine protease, partial [candidate division Zixibacteria bacterium]|nr:serine protease [candidate division Zixibacteria bacterium]